MRLKQYLLEQFGPDVTYIDFPELIQSDYFDCGPTSLQSVLFYYGVDIGADEIADELGYGETSGSGANIPDIIKSLESHGIKTISKEYMTIDDLKVSIYNKWPVIIEIQAYPENDEGDWMENDFGHYVVVIGYDYENIYFEDPYSIRRTFLSYDELEKRWHGYGTDTKIFQKWGVICKGIPQWTPNDIEHQG